MTEQEIAQLIANMDPSVQARNQKRIETTARPETPLEHAERLIDARETYMTARKPRRGNPEARLVQAIKAALEAAGYRVYRCQQYRADQAGSTPGIPDLLVTRRGWIGLYGLEVKTDMGIVSPAQALGCIEGHIHLCSSVEDALAIMRAIACRIGRER